MKKILISGCLLALVVSITARDQDFSRLSGPYLGNKPPGEKPEVFSIPASFKISSCGGFVFSKKGDETFFFTIDARGRYTVMRASICGNSWTTPSRVDLSPGNQLHPFYCNNETSVIYGSERHIQSGTRVPYFNLWAVARSNGKWSEPRPLSGKINSGWENCGSCDTRGNLFFRRVSSRTKGDLFQTSFVGKGISDPVKLPSEINTAYDESHPAVSPAGDCIVFSSKRPGGFNGGKDELWVSFRIDETGWSKAINLGKEINNGLNTSCATISNDGKYLFFIRIEKGIAVPYWVSVKVIEKMRMK